MKFCFSQFYDGKVRDMLSDIICGTRVGSHLLWSKGLEILKSDTYFKTKQQQQQLPWKSELTREVERDGRGA